MSGVYLPKPYEVFVENHPEVAKAYEKLGVACHDAGPLDEKTRHLIKLGIATSLRSEGGVKAHTRRALLAGAKEDELRHAVILSVTTAGFPGMIAAMGWINEVLDAQKES